MPSQGGSTGVVFAAKFVFQVVAVYFLFFSFLASLSDPSNCDSTSVLGTEACWCPPAVELATFAADALYNVPADIVGISIAEAYHSKSLHTVCNDLYLCTLLHSELIVALLLLERNQRQNFLLACF